jgi:hypothetical protein
MEYLLQVIAAGALLAVFYLYNALAYVLMFVVEDWPVVLVFAFGLAVILFVTRGAGSGNAS